MSGMLCVTLDKQRDTWSFYDGYTGNTGEYDSDDDGGRYKPPGIIQSKILTSAEIFENTVQTYVQYCNEVHVLSMIISSFSGSYYALKAMDIVALVGSSCGCSRRGSGNNTPNKGRSHSSFTTFPSFNPQTHTQTHTQSNTQTHTQSQSNMQYTYFDHTHTYTDPSSIDDHANVHSGRTYALAALGKQLVLSPPPESQKRGLLREVWKLVCCTDNLTAYVTCVGAWLTFAKNHCG